jgi:hypothetical protein
MFNFFKRKASAPPPAEPPPHGIKYTVALPLGVTYVSTPRPLVSREELRQRAVVEEIAIAQLQREADREELRLLADALEREAVAIRRASR